MQMHLRPLFCLREQNGHHVAWGMQQSGRGCLYSCAAPTWVSRDIAFWSGIRRSTCRAVPTDGVIGRWAGWGTKWRKLGDGQPHSALQSIPSSSCRTIDNRDDSVTVTKIPARACDRPSEGRRRRWPGSSASDDMYWQSTVWSFPKDARLPPRGCRKELAGRRDWSASIISNATAGAHWCVLSSGAVSLLFATIPPADHSQPANGRQPDTLNLSPLQQRERQCPPQETAGVSPAQEKRAETRRVPCECTALASGERQARKGEDVVAPSTHLADLVSSNVRAVAIALLVPGP
jgi:hypothetical protein